MNKYIYAEKLIAEIDRLGDVLNDSICQRDALGPDWVNGGKKMLKEIRSYIESLQQEQPEEEMSDFVKEYCQLYKEGYADGQAGSEQLSDAVLKDSASELLSLARDQFIKDGYVIEKKTFCDAVEKVAPEVMKEVSDKVDMEEAISLGYEKGKAEALKDLPRWRRIMDNGKVDANGCHYTDSLCLIKQGWYRVLSEGAVASGDAKYLSVAELEKLPGFNE